MWTPEKERWMVENPTANYGQFPWREDHTRDAFKNKMARVLRRAERSREPFRPMVDEMAEVVIGHQTVKDPPTDEECEEYFALLESADELKGALAPTQESSEFFAPDDGLPIGIAFTGDWHCGAGGVAYGQLRHDLETIRDTPGLYVVGMGDYLEGVSTEVKAKSALYGGLFNDGGWQERLVLLRARICQGKWLAILAGNHDEWVYKTAGITRTDQLARELAAPYFCQGGGTIFAHVGEHRYVVAVTHNAKGNSRLNTSNAGRVTFDSWPQWDNCDVIVCGHLHYTDLHIQTRKAGRCAYLRSGTYKLRDGYAADNGFKPEWGVPLAVFYPDERKVIAFRGDDFDHALRFLASERQRYANLHDSGTP